MLTGTIFYALICSALWALSQADVPHTRKYFYAGGKYVTDARGSHFLQDQLYIEELTPASGATKPWPLVLIHGYGQTGTNWLNKPDGNPGWATYFLSKGYTVYITDQTSRGRSPWLPPPVNNATTLTALSAEVVQQSFTAPELYNNPAPYPSAKLHDKWPGGRGKGVIGQPAFDAYYASLFPSVGPGISQQMAMQAAGAALLDRIGKPVILFGHSEGGYYPWLMADMRPKLVKGIVSMEPAGPPFGQLRNGRSVNMRWGLTDIPLTYDPPVADPDVDIVKRVIVSNSPDIENCTIQADAPAPRRLASLKDVRVLLVTAEASWAVMHDWCTVAFLKQAGVQATHLQLAEAGIKGNGHMFFLETNSNDIAAEILKWVDGLK